MPPESVTGWPRRAIETTGTRGPPHRRLVIRTAPFSALVDASAEERARVLGDTAATDAELAATVAGMLAHAGDGAELQQVVDAAADALTAPVARPPRFGAFRVVGEIGRGGMGVVYEGAPATTSSIAASPSRWRRWRARARRPTRRFRLERQILVVARASRTSPASSTPAPKATCRTW